jgi:hypothetical protein
MIKKETTGRIWKAYREIDTAEKLLENIQNMREDLPLDKCKEDDFGRLIEPYLELGIPKGKMCKKPIKISPLLAECVIIAYIFEQKKELEEANECARAELGVEGVKEKVESKEPTEEVECEGCQFLYSVRFYYGEEIIWEGDMKFIPHEGEHINISHRDYHVFKITYYMSKKKTEHCPVVIRVHR